MKLSEAIRLGAMLRPQAFGDLFANGGSCAMGAAYEAIGFEAQDGRRFGKELKPWAERWNAIAAPSCPVCQLPTFCLCQMVGHINDFHWWTREQIADWVATLEPQEQPAQEDDMTTSDKSVWGKAVWGSAIVNIVWG